MPPSNFSHEAFTISATNYNSLAVIEPVFGAERFADPRISAAIIRGVKAVKKLPGLSQDSPVLSSAILSGGRCEETCRKGIAAARTSGAIKVKVLSYDWVRGVDSTSVKAEIELIDGVTGLAVYHALESWDNFQLQEVGDQSKKGILENLAVSVAMGTELWTSDYNRRKMTPDKPDSTGTVISKADVLIFANNGLEETVNSRTDVEVRISANVHVTKMVISCTQSAYFHQIDLNPLNGPAPPFAFRDTNVPLAIGFNKIVVDVFLQGAESPVRREWPIARKAPTGKPNSFTVLNMSEREESKVVRAMLNGLNNAYSKQGLPISEERPSSLESARNLVGRLADAGDPSRPAVILVLGEMLLDEDGVHVRVARSSNDMVDGFSAAQSIVLPQDFSLTGDSALWILDGCLAVQSDIAGFKNKLRQWESRQSSDGEEQRLLWGRGTRYRKLILSFHQCDAKQRVIVGSGIAKALRSVQSLFQDSPGQRLDTFRSAIEREDLLVLPKSWGTLDVDIVGMLQPFRSVLEHNELGMPEDSMLNDSKVPVSVGSTNGLLPDANAFGLSETQRNAWVEDLNALYDFDTDKTKRIEIIKRIEELNSEEFSLLISLPTYEPVLVTIWDLTRHNNPDIAHAAARVKARFNFRSIVHKQLQSGDAREISKAVVVLRRLELAEARELSADLLDVPGISDVLSDIEKGLGIFGLRPVERGNRERFYVKATYDRHDNRAVKCLAQYYSLYLQGSSQEDAVVRTATELSERGMRIFYYDQEFALRTARHVQGCGGSVSFSEH